MSGWNPRFVAYAREVHGADPGEALALDRKRFPGGVCAGFVVWIRERWAEFVLLNPEVNRDCLLAEDHAAFDEWLRRRA